MERMTPRAVFDLYSMMSNADKKSFLEMLGESSTAEVPFLLTKQMSVVEQGRYSEMVFQHIFAGVFPLMQVEARKLERESPNLSDLEFDKELQDRLAKEMTNYNEKVGELALAQLKDKRDRKSDPETIQRNIQICNLRKQDEKKWTLGRLAKQFEMTKQAIQNILKDEAKWRRLDGPPVN